MIQTIDPASRAVRKTHLGVLYLAGARLSSQMPNDLRGLRQSSGSGRMAFGYKSSAGIYRNPAIDIRSPLLK